MVESASSSEDDSEAPPLVVMMVGVTDIEDEETPDAVEEHTRKVALDATAVANRGATGSAQPPLQNPPN